MASNIDRTAATFSSPSGRVSGVVKRAIGGMVGTPRAEPPTGDPPAAVGGQGPRAATDRPGRPGTMVDRRPRRGSRAVLPRRPGRGGYAAAAHPQLPAMRALHGRALPGAGLGRPCPAAARRRGERAGAHRVRALGAGGPGRSDPARTSSRCRPRSPALGPPVHLVAAATGAASWPSCVEGARGLGPPAQRARRGHGLVDRSRRPDASTVRFLDAEGRTVSHWNKLLKGSLVRWLLVEQPHRAGGAGVVPATRSATGSTARASVLGGPRRHASSLHAAP